MPSWIGPWEIAIVLIIALLVFGPKKLPELGKGLGDGIKGFRESMRNDEVTGGDVPATPDEATVPK